MSDFSAPVGEDYVVCLMWQDKGKTYKGRRVATPFPRGTFVVSFSGKEMRFTDDLHEAKRFTLANALSVVERAKDYDCCSEVNVVDDQGTFAFPLDDRLHVKDRDSLASFKRHLEAKARGSNLHQK